jgi:hypothetical protein
LQLYFNKMIKSFIAILLIFFSSGASAQAKAEKIKIYWPDEFHWKIVEGLYNAKEVIEYVIPQKEKRKHWTLLGTTSTYKKRIIPYSDSNFAILKKAITSHSADAILTLLEKDTLAKTYWYIYKIEGLFNQKELRQESSIFYIKQGKYNLFEASITIKDRNFPEGFVEKWIAVFKKSELYYDF